MIRPPAYDGDHLGEAMAQRSKLVFGLRRHGPMHQATDEPIALQRPQRLKALLPTGNLNDTPRLADVDEKEVAGRVIRSAVHDTRPRVTTPNDTSELRS